jgi:hypothetical protein
MDEETIKLVKSLSGILGPTPGSGVEEIVNKNYIFVMNVAGGYKVYRKGMDRIVYDSEKDKIIGRYIASENLIYEDEK